MGKYILAVDQSTQGTKGLLFNEKGELTARADLPHAQIVNEKGWVEHDLDEIFRNTVGVCRRVIEKAGIAPAEISALGISNQRETSAAWNKVTGRPVCHAIVWQCARAAEICARHEKAGEAEIVRQKTGIPLSPYFPAAKLQWIMENVPEAAELAKRGELAVGTIDSWLVYKLTGGMVHRTDYSNASRTQLFNLETLAWDEELLQSFHIPADAMPEVVMSDSVFGMTDLEGLLPGKIPITGVLGDSHGALFGQNCRKKGELKATYGTGSSVMMNTGENRYDSQHGLVTSLAWGIGGRVAYVLEGNLNYTGASITWLKEQMGMISSASETEALAMQANPEDRAYFARVYRTRSPILGCGGDRTSDRNHTHDREKGDGQGLRGKHCLSDHRSDRDHAGGDRRSGGDASRRRRPDRKPLSDAVSVGYGRYLCAGSGPAGIVRYGSRLSGGNFQRPISGENDL